MNKSDLKPACVFEQFAKINQIPRPSKHEEKMIQYLKDFGESRGLETKIDETGNVLIRKPATKGFENLETVVLQSHMDMVCDKLVDHEIDFMNDPIETYIDGEWMRAKGTTLGADDGIGDAIELAILDSDDIITTEGIFHFEKEEAPAGYFFLKVALKGLVGGHSGDDINKKRANAIKLLARFIYSEMQKTDVRLACFNSGKMHNAIPRDGQLIIAVPNEYKESLRADWNVFAAEAEDEFHVTDTTMEFLMESAERVEVMDDKTAKNLIRCLQAMHNGILTMCQDEEIAWLVETSSNVASVQTSDNEVKVVASQRSNVMSNLRNMAATIKAVFELAGAEVNQGDGYPAWKMNANSELTKITVEAYRKLFKKDPVVLGIHAGLECGLFSEKYPHMDMVSFGPTLRGVHSPDERLLIPTVQMVWDHLLEILKNIPEKK